MALAFALVLVVFTACLTPAAGGPPPPRGILGVTGIEDSPQLLRITADGGVAPVSAANASAPFEQVAMGLGAVDSAAPATFFVVGLNASRSVSTVVGLSAASGEVTSACASPFEWTGAGEAIAFAGAPRGQLLVGGHEPATGARQLGSLDPRSCRFALLATLPEGLVSWAADVSAYSPATDELVMLFAADENQTRAQIASVALATGRTRLWPSAPGSACAGAETLSFDSVTGLIFAIGAPTIAGDDGGVQTRQLLALDPRGLNCSVRSAISPPFLDFLSGEAALDSEARLLHWVAQAGGADDDAPFMLVSTPLDSGTGNSTAVPLESCTGAFAFSCPWIIAFLDTPAALAAADSGAAVVDVVLAYAAHQASAIYTTVGASAAGAFAAATWLAPPIAAASWSSASPNGSVAWSWSSSSPPPTDQDVYSVDVARRGARSAGSVDTFALRTPFPPNVGACVAAGLSSAGTGEPVWTYTVPAPCATDYQDIGGAYSILRISDSGTTAAFAAVTPRTDNASASSMKVFGLDAQTGALRFVHEYGDTLTPFAPTDVQVSGDGRFVLHTVWHQDGSGCIAYIFNASSGALRGSVPAFPFSAEISYDGGTVASATLTGPSPQTAGIAVFSWNASTAAYEPLASLLLPPLAPDDGQWWPEDLSLSDSPDGAGGGALVALASTTGTHSVVRVTFIRLGGAGPPVVVADWLSELNSDGLANIATLAADGDFVAVALYGDRGEASAPTAALFRAGSREPLLEFVSEGSLGAVDVVAFDNTTAVVAFAGKATNAGVPGAGGDVFVFNVTIR
jgi:hypothetical protein